MANSTSIQIIIDGPRNAVVKFEGVLDSSDLSSTTVVDPATLAGIDNTGNLKASKLRITNIKHNIEDGLSVNFFWDATTPVRIEELTGRANPCYEGWGGLTNNSGAGQTGKITATTEGWGSGIKSFSVILEMVKVQ